MPSDILSGVRHKAIEEGKRLFWIFLYLWALLGLFSLHKALVSNDQNLFSSEGFALINALLLAKVMFIGEIFHVADNLRQKPLIYPVMLRSAVFAMLLVSFHLLEEVLLGLWAGKTVTESISNIGGGTVKGILVVGFIIFVVLIPFFAANELGRVIGKDKLYEVFFVRRSALGQTASRADAISS